MAKLRNASVIGLLVVAGLGAVAGIAWAAGDWSAAQSKVEDLKRKQMDLRKMSADEIRRLVKTTCENADEDERKSVATDAANRVASLVSSEKSNLERMRDDANRALDDVINDDNLKDKRDNAKSLKDDVAARWRSIENMANNAMRGGNHPIVSYLSLRGIEEHKNYQSSNCHVSEFDTGSRRADCLRADGDTCYVIELKPNNSRAISKGQRQARDAADDLNNGIAKMQKGEGSDVMKRLIDKKSDFARCKRFEAKLKCYSLCPDVNDDSEYREGSASWSDC
jgi:hypothetical protein